MDWYFKVLSQYADFEGRARRKEYWMFTLFHMIAIMLLYGIIGIGFGSESSMLSVIGSVLVAIYVLGTLIPSLAVMVRRLHDIGKSGWYYFISFIPIVGSILLIVWFCTDSQPGDNQYGPNPKDEDMDISDHLIDDEMV